MAGWLVVCCDFIGDISLGINPSVKYKYKYRWRIWYRWHSRFAVRFFCSLLLLLFFFFSVDSQTYIRIYNTRSTTICCNLYVSIFHICAWSTTNTIEDEPFECEQNRAGARFALQKWWKRNVKKFVCKLVICILCGPSGRSLFFRIAVLFFLDIFRLLTLDCCYFHFLEYRISSFFSVWFTWRCFSAPYHRFLLLSFHFVFSFSAL